MAAEDTHTYLLAQVAPAQSGLAAEEQQATAELHAEPGHGGTFPPFQVDTFASQILWLALTFGAFYWLMAKVALPRVGSILEIRRDRIASDLAEAQKLKDETDEAIAAYEDALAKARAKAQSIAAETRAKTALESEAGRKAIEASLDEKLKAAEARISATKAEALKNVRGIAVDAAAAIVEQLLGKPPASSETEAAVDAALGR